MEMLPWRGWLWPGTAGLGLEIVSWPGDQHWHRNEAPGPEMMSLAWKCWPWPRNDAPAPEMVPGNAGPGLEMVCLGSKCAPWPGNGGLGMEIEAFPGMELLLEMVCLGSK